MKIRWKWWVTGLVGVLGLYTLAGFVLLPLLVRQQLPGLAQTQLARQASIGQLSFNPYTLRLQARDLRLSEADGAPLLALEQLALQLQWQSLLRRAWCFTEIRIIAPSASLTVAPDGSFNLAQLLATLQRGPPDSATDKRLPRLSVGQLLLEGGKLALSDRRAGYAESWLPINFTLNNFSTLAGQNNSYTFSATSARGASLRASGELSLAPLGGSGQLTLENASLPELAVYLKSYTRATLAAGKLAATLPYRFSLADGKLEARLAGAKLALRDLALAHEGNRDSFATLTRLELSGIAADLARREATLGEVRAQGGRLALRRNAKGELDLAGLMKAALAPAAVAVQPVPVNNWKLAVKQLVFDQLAVSALDESVSPALRVNADKVQLRLQLVARQAAADFQWKISDAGFSLADLVLTSGTQAPVKLARLGFSDGVVDSAARQARFGRIFATGGQLRLTRDRQGQLDLLRLLPKFGAAGAKPAGAPAKPVVAPWSAVAGSVVLSQFGADLEDQGSGVKVRLQDFGAKLEGVSSDLRRPVKFKAGLSLREGGRLSAQGSLLPGSGAVRADVRVKQLALRPLQPLLDHYLKLKIAGGSVSAQGLLTTGSGTAKSAALRYVGGLDVAGLVLNEEDGDLFASWNNVGAQQLTFSLQPNLLAISELRVLEPNAKLIIENDRTFNAARLLVPAAPAAAGVEAPAPAAASAEPFPVRIPRLRLQNGKLDFTDLSLRPQFAAKIVELNGVVTGLSSNRDSRSQIELDGRVDEFGLARIRGELNPFAPRNSTDLNVVFKNVDMVPASPYSMKFAGYRIAEGRISLDLQYKVRNSQLEGANQIVIDRLTLGERVDSPDALKLPLELAIAVLKDSDGRIDLGLPVSGDLSDPQFSYGAVVWKAIGNVLGKIVTAPFRALGSLLGFSSDKLEAIDFDPGSATLLPPEREKLKQMAQILAKRSQLKLSVPGHYSEAADGAALRTRAMRLEVAQRAGIKLEAGEQVGPLALGERSVRVALRDAYAQRFGTAALDRQKQAAASAPAAPGGQTDLATEKLPLWQRASKLLQGEPQVADASAFYRQLQDQLAQQQTLPAAALTDLGAQRASAILAALQEDGVAPASLAAAAPESVDGAAGKAVALKLGLTAK
ncbi:MAG: DUF748 domain-containing protein [Rhodoferax sp.]|uniref:DUF748 domain-containing protein n=1 Tax=Rhodoferax sp. TaxID=50421 RepID=UPI002635B4AF|nr:DUF748 domain-containing protein [Rhodoferax sp.]MDD5332703.1 DUF748 domain-containing protein [Rhodoferax sp.]